MEDRDKNINLVTMIKQDPLKYALYLLFIGVLVLIVFLRANYILW
ncbi:MAG: hypothetical protein ACXV7G_11520 [Halobacteriota archaeon]